MKKLFLILPVFIFAFPVTIFALTDADCANYGKAFHLKPGTDLCTVQYSCAGASTEIAPLETSAPKGVDASQVSTYIQQCGSAGGTVSGPSEQDLQPPEQPGASVDGTATGEQGGGSATTPTSNPPTPQQGSPSGTTNQPNQNTNSTGGSSSVSPFCTLQGGRTVCTYVPLEPLPCTDKNGNQLKPGSCQTGNLAFSNLLAAAFKLLITLGSLFAVVMIVVYGILYMLSNTPVKLAGAKERMLNALWGLLILGGAWLIIYTVNPKILQFNQLTTDLELSARNVLPTTQNVGAQNQPFTNQQLQDAQASCTNGKVALDQNNNLTCFPNL